MCLFTHFAAGALVGGLTGNVYAAAVAGVASHAVLDVIPHYDHPDWRLELGGGLASLLLLAVLPFASWPAVVGGLAGMLPDLENLFQKLGKMRRDQFLFPTHTGLLPHGRNLGPRSLGWQAAIFAGCFLLLGLLTPGAAQAAAGEAVAMARPVVTVIESGSERTVLRVEFPVITAPLDWSTVDSRQVQWALPLYADNSEPTDEMPVRLEAPRLGLSLAVPTRSEVTAEVRDLAWWKEPAGGRFAGELVRFSAPVVARTVPLTGTELPLAPGGGILRSATIEVLHPAQGAAREALILARELEKRGAESDADWANWRPSPPPGLLNPDLYAALAQGGRQQVLDRREAQAEKAQVADLFGLTRNWLKLNLTETGLYRVTGQDLAAYGVATSAVDPGKLRLYRGGGLPLAADPQFPDSLQVSRVGLNEVAIEVIGGGDGEWNLDDEFRFYGVGTSVWRDRLDPTAQRLDHFDHPYAAEAVYWLSWENDQTPSPLPGVARRVAAVNTAATGGVVQSTARVRLHREEQFIDAAAVVEDSWVWDNSIFSSRQEAFNLRPPVPGSTTRFQVDVRGVYVNSSSFVFRAAAHLNNDAANQGTINFRKFVQSDGLPAQDDSVRIRIFGTSTAAVAGVNQITISNNSTDTPLRPLALDSYDILYWTELNIAAGPGQLEFAHWRDQVPAPGTAVDLQLTATSGTVPLLWDVTDPAGPQVWTGSTNAAVTTYGMTREPGSDRHFVACRVSDLRQPLRGQRVTPIALRARTTDLDYMVLHPGAFTFSAQDLAAFRSTSLPGVVSPAAVAVNVDDIYDNFSGGQKDPRAIRNYLKWVYEQSGLRLKYVCLLGNASRDYRNFRGRTPLVDLYDLVSTEVRSEFPRYPTSLSRQLAYASDDGLVSFDTPPAGDLDFPDLACGRLPALNAAEARGMVERAIRFDAQPEPGDWRNRVLFTADDVVRPNANFPNPTFGEYVHTQEAEDVTTNYLPPSLDIDKVYGVAYDFPPGSLVKPTMRLDINARLNAGTSIFYYVGHGAEDNLADEQVFQSRDVPNLNNGMKRPLFVAFSCDVGVFDSPSRRSMAEQFIQYENGGAIGAICASQVSYTFNNDALTEAFFAALYPSRHVSAARTAAEALRLGKTAMTLASSYRSNSQRYNFFGDPGQAMPHPVDDLVFAPGSLDTLRAGARQVVRLSEGGKVLLGAGDAYRLRVEESAFGRRFAYTPSLAETSYVHPGSPVFAGSGTMAGDDLVVPFKVPVQLRYGSEARVRLILETPDGDRVAVARVPAVRAAIGANDDIIGPQINLGFGDNRYRVRPGEELVATLADTSGIAILGTSPGNSLLLEFDDSGFMTDVTGAFAYDADSYTNGRLTFALPGDLEQGRHLAALHASDALGNVGSDTLSFEIRSAGVTEISAVTLFPNPTAGYCRLVFELSDPMEVQWDIYTLAGNRLYSRKTALAAGPQILEWDGRDARQDEIANGTYLYVLRGLGAGADNREIRKTGKLVMMR